MPDAPDFPTTLCEAFQRTVARDPDARGAADPRRRREPDLARVRRAGAQIAGGLHALGVRRGHTVGLMMTNRPEMALVDVAATHLGAAPFSVYNTSTTEQIAYLFGNAGNRVVVCEAASCRRCSGGEHRLDHVVCIDAPPTSPAPPRGPGSRRARRPASTSRRPGGPSSPTTWRR